MDRQELKAKIIEFFRAQILLKQERPQHRPEIQFNDLHGLVRESLTGVPQYKHVGAYSVVHEIVHELIGAGFLYPGQPATGAESGYPWLTITEYGHSAFLAEEWLPYDPEGYLDALKTKVPALDAVTAAYIGESVAAFNRRNLLSATITLGVASENLMLRLIEAYGEFLKPPRQATFQRKVEHRGIYMQFKEFKKEFSCDVKTSVPSHLQGDWESYLDGVFNFIRVNRNKAGHPTGKRLDAKVVYANLQMFAEYANYVEALIASLK